MRSEAGHLLKQRSHPSAEKHIFDMTYPPPTMLSFHSSLWDSTTLPHVTTGMTIVMQPEALMA